MYGAPVISNTIVTNNRAYNGDGIYIRQSSATIRNCLISFNSSNISEQNSSGGVYFYGVDGPEAEILNSTIVNNTTTTQGGGVRAIGKGLTITDSIIWGNSVAQGDPASNQIAGDPEISFSCIQDGADLAGINGNIDMNPLFTSTYLGDYFLSKRDQEGVNSPCLNTGSGNAGDMGLNFMTTASNLVHDSGRVDMGFHYPYFVIPFLEGDVDNNDMLDIVDALRVAQAYVGLSPGTFFYEAADINRDKKMDIIDALLIAQYFVGLNPN